VILALFYIVIAAGVVRVSYFIFLFVKLLKYRSNTGSAAPDKPTSLVVCFKNDKNNVLKNLPFWQSQGNIPLQIILMNDFSDDSQQLKLNEPNIKLVNVITNLPGKKQALIEGFAHADGECILLTDADCKPASSTWAASMLNQLKDKDIVLGYGPMNKKTDLLNLFSRFETFMTAVQYFSYALQKWTYMGVGRNILYRKTILNTASDAFINKNIASGDDDLLVQKIATSDNVAINIDPDSFVYSDAPVSLKAYINQKSRHQSTAVHYKAFHQALLGTYAASQMVFWAGFLIILLFGTFSIKYLLILPLIKWTIEMSILSGIMKKLKEEDLIWWHPVLDFLTFVYYSLFTPFLILKNKNSHWK
jgi:glycosyltransferase involved in cell wall biosynthesis